MRVFLSSALLAGCFLLSQPETGQTFALTENFQKPNLVLTQGRDDSEAVKPKSPSILGAGSRGKTAKNLSAKGKARARAVLHKRSMWQHFAAIDSNGDKQLGYNEMVHYFSEMHTVFDQIGDGIVSKRGSK